MKRASTTQANLGNFACIKHFVTFVLKRVEIIAIRIKKTQIHFLRDVFPLSLSCYLKLLLEELTPGGKTLLPVTVLDASAALAYSL